MERTHRGITMIFLPKHKGITLSIDDVVVPTPTSNRREKRIVLEQEEMDLLHTLIDKYKIYYRVGSQASGMAKELTLRKLRQQYYSITRYGTKNSFSKLFESLDYYVIESIKEVTPKELKEYKKICNKVEGAFK